MLLKEIHRNFKIFLDKIDSSFYSEFNDGEIDVILNESILRIVKQRYGGLNPHRSSFEESQKRTEDLKNLVVTKFFRTTKSTTYEAVGMNVYEADLLTPYNDITLVTASLDKYFLLIKCVGVACKGTCCSTYTTKLVQQDDIYQIKNDPFNKPTNQKALLFFENGNINVWAERVVRDVLVTYVKMPAKVNLGTYGSPLVECDLSEHLHPEIVQIAVGIALENIESPRQNTQEGLNSQRIE